MKKQSFSVGWSLAVVLLLGTVFVRNKDCFVFAKEIVATKEWQLLGENDTIPQGMHVRMDMTTGEKWVKILDDEDDDEKRETATDGSTNTALVQSDGSVSVYLGGQKESQDTEKSQYDFDAMHRTLSKLPEEEKERMGGLPEIPVYNSLLKKRTPEEQEMFEKRMAEIWEKRQQVLRELQESMVDGPEVLKDRIQRIKDYLKNPTAHLEEMKSDRSFEEGKVTHILSAVYDLEAQLSDLDMARDFHILQGWPLLVSLLSDEVHVSQNQTQNATETKKPKRRSEEMLLEELVHAVQEHAAWVIGTAVKNIGEFNPYAIEVVNIGTKKTTAVDLLIDLLSKDYNNPNSWDVRKLHEKVVFGIGSLLRGNRMAQTHFCGAANGPDRLGKVLHQVSSGDSLTSTNAKLSQRLLSLASDIVSDINLDGDVAMKQLNDVIVKSFTSSYWCDPTMNLLLTDKFLPLKLQETVLETAVVLAPYCSWHDQIEDALASITKTQGGWEERKDEFDPDHLDELFKLAHFTSESLKK
jgi:nucleotide exchange factor SIL1